MENTSFEFLKYKNINFRFWDLFEFKKFEFRTIYPYKTRICVYTLIKNMNLRYHHIQPKQVAFVAGTRTYKH